MSRAESRREDLLDLAFVGFGHVARRFARLLEERRSVLQHQHPGLCWRIVGILTRRHGAAINPDGIDAVRAAELVERESSLDSWHNPSLGPASRDGREFIAQTIGSRRTSRPADLVMIETTVLDVARGQPAIDHVRAALAAGAHVITANKGPVAFAYRELQDLADAGGVSFLFEAAVMDGIPVFGLVRETLPAVEIRGFRGILNSTTSYILTAMEAGRPFDAALNETEAAGIAEADASLDLDGWDAAIKVAALANVLMDGRLNPHEIERTGIRGLTAAAVQEAARQGMRLKLVASAERAGQAIIGRVAPLPLPADDPLANLSGTANGIIFQTDVLGDLAIIELDAGLTQTAYGLLSDLVTIWRRRRARPAALPRRTP